MKSLSLILYAAYNSLQPCETVFKETAKAANPTLDFTLEQAYLDEFASAACETSNPDMLWLIAQQESNFRFRIIVENKEKPLTLKGDEALVYLKKLKKAAPVGRPNVDIGVLQFNWGWHQKGFHQNPLLALSPRKQVDYFLKTFGKEIYRRCDEQWVGCYHNQKDNDRAQRYQLAVQRKGQLLALKTLYFIRDHRKNLSPEELRLVPEINKEDFYRTLETARGMPLPRKQILHFVDDRPAPQQDPMKLTAYDS